MQTNSIRIGAKITVTKSEEVVMYQLYVHHAAFACAFDLLTALLLAARLEEEYGVGEVALIR